MKSLYDILGVSKNATTDDIKTAYRRQIRHYHPDTGEHNAQKVLELNHAYEILKDPEKRKHYDQSSASEFWRAVAKAHNTVKQNLKENVEFLKTLKDQTFTQNFDDHVSVWVYPWQAIFGDKVAVHTDFHHLLVPMPAFEQSLTLTIKGAGKPKGNDKFGDLTVDFFIKVPKADALTDTQKRALQNLKTLK